MFRWYALLGVDTVESLKIQPYRATLKSAVCLWLRSRYVLVNASNGLISAKYEYGPFGEQIHVEGNAARGNPFRWSTKFYDDETGLIYYGVRYYRPETGSWLSKDLVNELGFKLAQLDDAFGDDDLQLYDEGNCYRYVRNNPLSKIDAIRLWPSASPFFGRFLNSGFALPLTHENSDKRVLPLTASDVHTVDAASVFVDEAQGVGQSFQHAMRAPGESKDIARSKANAWIRQNLIAARSYWCSCNPMDHEVALWYFGLALHTIQDSTSPAHHGFQIWRGLTSNPATWLEAEHHVAKETWDPGTGSNLDGATGWLWSFMTCPGPVLPSDFFIFDADENWWND